LNGVPLAGPEAAGLEPAELVLAALALAGLDAAALGLLELELHAASPRLATATAEATSAVGCLIMIALPLNQCCVRYRARGISGTDMRPIGRN
jgi:hypothetical protein